MLKIETLERMWDDSSSDCVVKISPEDMWWSEYRKAICIKTDAEEDDRVIIPFEEISLNPNFNEKYLTELRLILSSTIAAVIVGVDSNGYFILSRKEFLIRAALETRVDRIYSARVQSICNWAAFLELENGALAMLHIASVSQGHIESLKKFLPVGEILRVRVLSKEYAPNYWIRCTRKITKKNTPCRVGDIRRVKVCKAKIPGEYLCEISPTQTGYLYANNGEQLHCGQLVWGSVKKVFDDGAASLELIN